MLTYNNNIAMHWADFGDPCLLVSVHLTVWYGMWHDVVVVVVATTNNSHNNNNKYYLRSVEH